MLYLLMSRVLLNPTDKVMAMHPEFSALLSTSADNLISLTSSVLP